MNGVSMEQNQSNMTVCNNYQYPVVYKLMLSDKLCCEKQIDFSCLHVSLSCFQVRTYLNQENTNTQQAFSLMRFEELKVLSEHGMMG